MRKKLEKPVLAEGEVTGHAHMLDGPVDVFQVDEDAREFSLDEVTNLVHEEHKSISIHPGIFESGQVLEYDPFAEEVRKVAD